VRSGACVGALLKKAMLVRRSGKNDNEGYTRIYSA
jgi:hypothetical protein